MRGEAEAFAVEAKGRAEAEQMAKKAEAFQQYKEGAMVDMLLEKLPLVRHSKTTYRVHSVPINHMFAEQSIQCPYIPHVNRTEYTVSL